MSRTRTWTRLVEDLDLDSVSGYLGLRLGLGLGGLNYNTVNCLVDDGLVAIVSTAIVFL